MIPSIHGIGVAVPKHFILQHDAAAMATELTAAPDRAKAAVTTLYRRTGVASRHCVMMQSSTNGVPAQQEFFRQRMSPDDLGPSTGRRMRSYETEALRLSTASCTAAIDEAGVDASQITHLVTATCTGFAAPGFDLQLVDILPLGRSVERTQVGFMGCHAALNAMRVARAYANADPAAVVLVCATELCSLHFQYSDHPQKIVSNALFADGSAAMVICGSSAAKRAAGAAGWRLTDCASLVLPNSTDLMSWRIGDHGFEMSLSPQVPDVIAAHLPAWIDAWLTGHGLKRRDVGTWAIHPGGRRILSAAAESLDLSTEHIEPSQQVLRDYGNMSSPTVLFILREQLRTGAQPPAVMLAFGPGLTIEAALLT